MNISIYLKLLIFIERYMIIKKWFFVFKDTQATSRNYFEQTIWNYIFSL